MNYLIENKILLIVFGFLVCILPSCNNDEEEDAEMLKTAKKGTIVNVESVGSSFFNLTEIDISVVTFTIGFDGEKPQLVKVFKQLNFGEKVLLGEYSDFPAEISVSAEDAVAGSEMTLADLEVGDVFTFTFEATQPDGFPTPSGTVLNASVACPSALAGTYTTRTSGFSTDPGPEEGVPIANNPLSDYEYEVTLTEGNVNGVYTISDFSGGAYKQWYDVYNITDDSPGTIQDVCNTISYSNTNEPFGTAVTGGGEYDPETGIITLSGTNGYGDTWSIVLTPKE